MKQGGNAARIRGVGYSSGQNTSSGFKGAFRDAFGVVELASNSFSGKYILCPLFTDIYKLAAEKQLSHKAPSGYYGKIPNNMPQWKCNRPIDDNFEW